MTKQTLQDGSEVFEVTVLRPAKPSCTVLFAVGGGGDPRRHLPLLESLAEYGCTVVAPHFERLLSPSPAEDQLLLRARRLRLALDSVAGPEATVAGVGHSIGTTMLLALAGAKAWMGPGHPLLITADTRIHRLVLLAPATAYFQAPGALDGVNTPILAWAGTEDTITPPVQAELLRDALGTRVPVQLRVTTGAGHFTFMNVPPPQSTESLPNRDAFLQELTAEVCGFVSRSAGCEREVEL